MGAAGPADPLGDWQPVEPKMSVTETQEMEQFHAQVEAEEQKLAKVGICLFYFIYLYSFPR